MGFFFLQSGIESLRDARHRFVSQIFDSIDESEETESELDAVDTRDIRKFERAITSSTRMRH